MSAARELREIRLTITVDGQPFLGSVKRTPMGWRRHLFDRRGYRYLTYASGMEGGRVPHTAVQAVETLIADVGRIWGVDVDRSWYWDVEDW
jgi:hypothetical protein